MRPGFVMLPATNREKGTFRLTVRREFLFRSLIWPLAFVLLLSACTPSTTLEVAVKISPPPARAIATLTPTPRSAGPATATPAPKCGVTELLSGQTISSSCSYTQTETEAAGPMICRIQRDSCAYKNLVTNRDPDIVFNQHKPPPLTDEDAMIHPAMLLPLTRLSALVKAEWGDDAQTHGDGRLRFNHGTRSPTDRSGAQILAAF